MKNIRLVLLSVLMLYLVFFAGMCSFAEGSSIGKIIAYEGDVRIFKSGAERSFNSFRGMAIVEGDRIETGPDSNVTIEIGGTKEVKIGDDTKLSFSELSKAIDEDSITKLNLSSGKIWVNVKEKLSEGSKFEIKTPTAVMGVRGTQFYVKHDNKKTELKVLEGNVQTKMKRKVGKKTYTEDIRFVPANLQIEIDNNTSEIINSRINVDDMDLFLLETIKENPERVDPKILENIDQKITEKQEEYEKSQLDEESELLDSSSSIESASSSINENIVFEKIKDAKVVEQEPVFKSSKRKTNRNTTIRVSSLEISQKEKLILEVGDLASPSVLNKQIEATIYPINATNKTVSWQSSDESVVRVNETGYVESVGVGKAYISVRTEDGGYEAGFEVSVLEKNTIRVTSIEISQKEKLILEVGDLASPSVLNKQIEVTIYPINATNKTVSWQSSDESVVRVNETGYVESVGVGEAYISVRTEDGGYEAGFEVSVLEKNTIRVTSIEISQKEKLILEVGDLASPSVLNKQIEATIYPINATNKTVSWQSSDESVVRVNETGYVESVGVGEAYISVRTEDGGYEAGFEVSVSEKYSLSSIVVSPSNVTIGLGEVYQLSALYTPENALNKNITWRSLDEGIASVSDGLITGVSVGSVAIELTSEDGNHKAEAAVDVKIFVDNIVIGPMFSSVINNKFIVENGMSDIVMVSIYPLNATDKDYDVTITDTTIAEVQDKISDSFEIRGLSRGETTLLVSSKDNKYQEEYTIEVIKHIPPLPEGLSYATGVDLNLEELTIERGSSSTVVATVQPEGNCYNNNVIWSSKDENIATVSNGIITGVSEGTTTIEVITEDTMLNDIGYKDSVTVHVTGISVTGISLDKSEFSMYKGQKTDLLASISPSNADNKAVEWSSYDNNVALVSGGQVTANGIGSTKIVARTSDGGFEAFSTVNVEVALAESVIVKDGDNEISEITINGDKEVNIDISPVDSEINVDVENPEILEVDFNSDTGSLFFRVKYIPIEGMSLLITGETEIYIKNKNSDLIGTISVTIAE